MLQLTQRADGGITGVVSIVQLDGLGKVNADESSITGGTLDGTQLTLTLHPGIFGANISGTKDGNTIHLQGLDSEGRVTSSSFTRSPASEFGACADGLRQKSAIIALNSSLSSQSQHFHQVVQDAEVWQKDAQLHASRIPLAEDHYSQIQDAMQKLVKSERFTLNSVDRSQISVAVDQQSIDGDQFDIEVNQTWDWPIEGELKTVTQQLSSCVTICSQRDAYRPGVDPTIREQWESGCRNVMTEQSSLQPIADKVMEQRSELKTFQDKAKSLREATVAEAEKLARRN